MNTSFKLFSVRGISLYLHFTLLIFVFWFLLLILISGMSTHEFIWSVIFLCCVYISIALHEYGHAYVAAQFGITARRITLYPIGGVARIENLPEHPKEEILISLAGPCISICIAAVLLLFTPDNTRGTVSTVYSSPVTAETIFYATALFNIALAVLNLIPAFPLDGGRILRAVLALKYNYVDATIIAAAVSKVIASLMIIGGLFSLNLPVAITGLFLILFAQAEETYLRLKTLMKNVRLKDVLMYDYSTIGAHLLVSEAALILENNHSKYFVVLDKGKPAGVVSRTAIIKSVGDEELNVTVADVMKPDRAHLDGEAPVEKVVSEFVGNDEKIYPVFDKERLLGVVSMERIMEYMLLHRPRHEK